MEVIQKLTNDTINEKGVMNDAERDEINDITTKMIRVQNYTFLYPTSEHLILNHVNLTVQAGEFVVLCGKSGCGKTTLLRCMKPQIAPVGHAEGEITKLPAAEVGFVFQNPDNQIVTDTVRHELAFGLENIGMPTVQIRARVAETALFFGIDEWIDKSVHEISGGEKQLLNLAAVIAMQPKVLILDEPTSQLDPVARKNFLDMLLRVNRELGIAVILSEHRLEEILPLADRILYMNEGTIEYSGTPQEFAAYVFKEKADFAKALPAASRIAWKLMGREQADAQQLNTFPMTVREGQEFLRKCETEKIQEHIKTKKKKSLACLDIRDIWFQYAKQTPFVLKGLNLTINWGEMHMILGGNGSGKSTLLGILAKRFYPNRGKIKVGKKEKTNQTVKRNVKNSDAIRTELLPQNPKAMFSRDTVREELELGKSSEVEQRKTGEVSDKAEHLVQKLQLESLLNQHPYDLSGGEQQRLALAMVLQKEPDVLLLDEPTKGLDPFLKEELAGYLHEYISAGGTVLCVTHDVEFAAEYGDVCSLLFEGEVLSTQDADTFFKTNLFYTTDENRIFTSYLK